jgi:hypothetical protein
MIVVFAAGGSADINARTAIATAQLRPREPREQCRDYDRPFADKVDVDRDVTSYI